jgi:predicted GNAT family N-acyltransferase
VLNPESVDITIKLLEKHHHREDFSCGNEQLDRYLQTVALQDKKRNIAIPYVVCHREGQKIIGYYTLSMSSINLEYLPPNIAKKLPKYPIVGVTLIGRLAVAIDYKGYGWGKLLLMDALYRSFQISQTTGCFAVIVDAIDDRAVKFYQRFEFQSFQDRPDKLFRTMTNIAQTFDANKRT